MKTPYFLIDEPAIQHNLKILDRVRREAGCKILLAQKAFSCYDCYPLISKYLDGTTASGLFEARLGAEKFGGETHVFAPAFTDDDMSKIVKIANHIVFNCKAQLLKHYVICRQSNMSIAVRVNPEFSTQDGGVYDPCAPMSRFGIMERDFDAEILRHIDGIHFHTLCEQGFEPLSKTVAAFEAKFGKYLFGLKFVNFGGGHHITAPDYDVDGLINLIKNFRTKYGVEVYLEPGEAIVLNAGTLHSTVMDIVHNARDIAILDVSAACHISDALQSSYIPRVRGAMPLEDSDGKGVVYRLAGNTCLSGDKIGDYVFNKPLKIGSEVVFEDMALYTIVKLNFFNGICPPAIYRKSLDDKIELLKEFDYNDFKNMLGK